jgi:predicted metalloprotease
LSETTETLSGQIPERRRILRRVLAGLAVLTVAASLTSFAWQAAAIRRGAEPLPQPSAERAAVIGRRVGVVFDDAERTWARWFQARGLPAPAPARLVLYTYARPTPCSDAAPGTGPFYCPLDSTAAFDLAFLEALEAQMRREGELGTALVVARVVAEHIQAALGTRQAARRPRDAAFEREYTLQADCLAGVWAGMAADRLGTVPPGLYARVMGSGKEAGRMLLGSRDPGQPALDIFLYSDDGAREAAFRRGLVAADPAACPGPR